MLNYIKAERTRRRNSTGRWFGRALILLLLGW